MRLIAILVLLFSGGCTSRERLSGSASDIEARIKLWVPVGMPSGEAKSVMEKHGFSCKPLVRGVHKLECVYSRPATVLTWIAVDSYAVLSLSQDDRVSSVEVTTNFTGL